MFGKVSGVTARLAMALAAGAICRVSADDVSAAPDSAYHAKVDPKNGVIIDVDSAKLRTLPAVKIESATEVDQRYSPPAGVEFDYYQYSLSPEVDNGEGTLSLSVLDAENMALAHSWQLRSALAGRDVARGKKYGAIGGLLPSFGYSAKYGVGQTVTDDLHYTPAERSTFSQAPTFTQPLFHGGALISSLREAYLNDDKVEQDIRTQRRDVRTQIRQLYYLCLYNKKAADVLRKQTDISYQYWQKTQKRYEAEDVPEIEVLRYQVQYQLNKSAYITTRNDYNTSVTRLLRYLGQPLKSNIFLNDAFDFTDFDPGSEDALTQYALTNRSDLKSSEIREQMLKQQVKQARAGLLPTIDGTVGFSQGTAWKTERERYVGNWGWSAGVQLNWNALAGMGQVLRGKIMQANAALTQAEFATADISDQIKQDVRNAVIEIFSASDAVKAQQENVEQANRLLTQENIRWDEGASAYLQILDAQQSVADSELAYWRGIYNFKTAVVTLEAALGKFYQSTKDEVRAARATQNGKSGLAKKVSGENPLDALATPQTLKSEKSAKLLAAPAPVNFPRESANRETAAKKPISRENRDFSALGGAPVNLDRQPPSAQTAARENEKSAGELRQARAKTDTENYTPPQMLTPLAPIEISPDSKSEKIEKVSADKNLAEKPLSKPFNPPAPPELSEPSARDFAAAAKNSRSLTIDRTRETANFSRPKNGANRAVNSAKLWEINRENAARAAADNLRESPTNQLGATASFPLTPAAVDVDVMANPSANRESHSRNFLAEPELE